MGTITKIDIVENMLKLGNYLKMYRIDYNGRRIYIEKEPFNFYSGLTGALSASTFKNDPDAKRLSKWRTSMIDSYGEKNTNDYVDLTADFGSLLHVALITIKEKGVIKWKEEKELATEYFISSFKEKNAFVNMQVINQMVYEYQKHVASLMQWVYERVQEIYAIETPAKWTKYQIATPIDVFCLCKQTDKGAFNKTTVNIKTSSQITPHQIEQIACEFVMWNETYENKADFTAITRTKDWNESKIPTFDYKYLSKEEANNLADITAKRLSICLESSASYLVSPINSYFDGETKIGERPKIVSKTLQEEWEEVIENDRQGL